MKIKVSTRFEVISDQIKELEFELTEDQVKYVNDKIKEKLLTNIVDLEQLVFDDLDIYSSILDIIYEGNNKNELNIIYYDLIEHEFKLFTNENVPCCMKYKNLKDFDFCPKCGKKLNR